MWSKVQHEKGCPHVTTLRERLALMINFMYFVDNEGSTRLDISHGYTLVAISRRTNSLSNQSART
jgi:hypothetical protein